MSWIRNFVNFGIEDGLAESHFIVQLHIPMDEDWDTIFRLSRAVFIVFAQKIYQKIQPFAQLLIIHQIQYPCHENLKHLKLEPNTRPHNP